MKRFTELFQRLDATTRTTEKRAALVDYFKSAPPRDAAWAVYVLAERKIGKGVSTTQLRQWAAELSGHPQWLVDECMTVAGDLSETLSLLVPNPADGSTAPPLHEIVEERLAVLGKMPHAQQKQTILRTWAELSTDQRLAFHKLLSGNFRVGVSRQMLVRALAEVAAVEPAIIAHRLAGHWVANEESLKALLAPVDADSVAATNPLDAPAVPYPFMLAHALHEPPADALGNVDDWSIEWKWDGIRAQVIRKTNTIAIWSRGDELVNGAFPEIVQAASALPAGTVIDGELLAWDDRVSLPLPFARLQRRLNRKGVEMSFWPEVPVTFVAFDVLERDGVDLRSKPLAERLVILDDLLKNVANTGVWRRSDLIKPANWDELAKRIEESRDRGVEGVMIKRIDSVYQPGRVTGLWWKLKVDPYTVDAVLIAAEPGHGRRAGLLTDYTFGVWNGDTLVPVAKAYSGLTDKEIAEVDKFARRHTLTKHGPVHVIEPLRVFELGFEAIAASTRHKSGVALRFPRMLRMRDDKTPTEADRLTTLQELLAKCERAS